LQSIAGHDEKLLPFAANLNQAASIAFLALAAAIAGSAR
jgi:hypothetical protein